MPKYGPLAKFLGDSARTEGTVILSFVQVDLARQVVTFIRAS